MDALEVEAMAQRVSNWGRWGPDDERGTLNLLTPQHVRTAASLIREGVTVPCARPVPVQPAADNPQPARHFMIVAGDEARIDPEMEGFEAVSDYLGINLHGLPNSHLDALSHVFIKGRMYNGYDASLVRSDGTEKNSIMAAADGIVGRGVLLDIPALRGVDWLEPGDAISVDDLIAAEQAQHVRVTEADILLVVTGRDARRAARGPWWHRSDGIAGLGVDCIPWLHERDIAVLGSDAISDVLPSGVPGWPMPIHQIVLVMMGCPLLDNLRLDRLAAACRQRRRWEFHFSVAPLHLERGTGCPVNPLATF